ncbi:MAG: hypothetical protein GYA23_06770 [Methanomicrobiales archaeon]|nr:hypothetical protein [Methanomicrobiales archaeon]
MRSYGLGLSRSSEKIIVVTLGIISIIAPFLVYLSEKDHISPMIFALLAAVTVTVLVLVIVYVVVREEGWQSIFPP